MEHINSTFDFYEEVPYSAPLKISSSDVEVVARHIGGAGGPGGVDEKFLKDWCTRFSSDSEDLW